MQITSLLIAALQCVGRIGLIDTARATLNRSKYELIKAIFGKEMSFRPCRNEDRIVFLRTGTADWVIFNQIFVKGGYDIRKFPQWGSIMRRYERDISSNVIPTIIDCGANIGLSAIWFSLLFPKSRILAIEMESNNFLQMKRNISMYRNITAINSAVWGEETVLHFHTDNTSTHAYSAHLDSYGGAPEEAIATITVDRLVREYNIESLFCIKIDIEGGEVNVLNNSKSWIERVKVLFVELHDWNSHGLGSGKALVGALQGLDIDILISGESIVAVAMDDFGVVGATPGDISSSCTL